MRWLLVMLLLTLVLSSCSYERSFRQTWDDGGGEDLLLISEQASFACIQDTWDERTETVIKEDETRYLNCYAATMPEAIIVGRHMFAAHGDSMYMPEEHVLSKPSGWASYADMLGSLLYLYENTFGTNETTFEENARRLNGAVGELMQRDVSLGAGTPELLLFSYRDGFTWGVGQGDPILIDGIEQTVIREGWFFRVPDLELTSGRHTLSASGESYELVVGDRASSVVDWRIEADHTTVRIESLQGAEIIRVQAPDCPTQNTTRENEVIEAVFACIPERLLVHTSNGSDVFTLMRPDTFDQNIPRLREDQRPGPNI